MQNSPRAHLANLRSTDKELQNAAFSYLIEATEKPVDWAYDVWDELVAPTTSFKGCETSMTPSMTRQPRRRPLS